nr:hypothetical protein [Ralstonia sp. ASV6]
MYKRQGCQPEGRCQQEGEENTRAHRHHRQLVRTSPLGRWLSLIHISEPTRHGA